MTTKKASKGKRVYIALDNPTLVSTDAGRSLCIKIGTFKEPLDTSKTYRLILEEVDAD